MSKQTFGNSTYHVEFRVPYLPLLAGQARGNSGVYLQGRYEVQVLDNFGDPPADNHCGGICRVAAPLVNACLPPGEWQTYDIDFRAPRFSKNGEKVADAVISVIHNGIAIHENVKIPGCTGGGIGADETRRVKIFDRCYKRLPEWDLPKIIGF